MKKSNQVGCEEKHRKRVTLEILTKAITALRTRLLRFTILIDSRVGSSCVEIYTTNLSTNHCFSLRFSLESDYIGCLTTRACCSAKYRMPIGTPNGNVGQSPPVSSVGYDGGDVVGRGEKEGGMENADAHSTPLTEKTRTSVRSTTKMESRSGDGMGPRGEDDGLLVSQLCREGSSVLLLFHGSMFSGLGHPLDSFGMSR